MSVISVEKDFDSLSLILVAEFGAPIERVWQLWADPRQLERWWGPPTHPATVETHRLAAGGEVSYVMTGPGGERSRGWWRVTSVDPPGSLECGDISMSGSPTTVRWLLREGLLDELNLLVHPIAVGDGLARLFAPDEPSIPLELLSAQTFNTGVLNLSYAPAKG